MKIECRIKRKGGTPVELPLASGRMVTYLFEPDPSDPHGPHFCEVTDPEHIGTLLGIKEGYKVASTNASVAAVTEEDLLETSAGETLTLFVTKSGHVSVSTLEAMGLQVVDLSLGGPTAKEPPKARTVLEKPTAKPAAAPKPAQKPAEPEKPAVPPAKDDGDASDVMTDDELAAQVKAVTGRAPKPGSTREEMIAALNVGN